MALVIVDSNSRRYVALSTDIVNGRIPNTNTGCIVYIVDTGETKIVKSDGTLGDYVLNVSLDNSVINVSLDNDTPFYILRGVATGGTETTLVDSAKDFGIDMFQNKILKIYMGDYYAYRLISGCIADTLTFATLGDATSAHAIVGDESGGQVTIRCIENGAVPYSVEVIAGTGESSEESISFANNILTITTSTDAMGVPMDIMAGNIHSMVTNTVGINEIFTADIDFVAGSVSLTIEPIAFSGGSIAVVVEEGFAYWII
jgi:hypothetical protein